MTMLLTAGNSKAETISVGSSADAQLLRHVVEALAHHSEIPPSVLVTVRDGVVTLSGTVAWAYQKAAAGRAAKDVCGSMCVDNQIQAVSVVSAGDVRGRVVDALSRRCHVEEASLRVRTEGRSVVLTGVVSSIVAKNEAERAAWRTPGVGEVRNELSVQL